MEKLLLTQIKCNGGTQSRAFMDATAIDAYADDMKEGAQFPPVVVFYDGTDYWMADGFHRWNAAKKAGLTEIDADIRQGDKRAAILYSVGANSISQVNRTIADKRRAVMVLLEDAEWSQWSDNAIAKQCGVSQPFVSGIRKDKNLTSNVISETRTYTTKHGTKSTMKTGEIGKKESETGTGQNPSQNPESPSFQETTKPLESNESENREPRESGPICSPQGSLSISTPNIGDLSKSDLKTSSTQSNLNQSPENLHSLCLELVENHISLLAPTPEAREWFSRLISVLDQ